MAKHASKPSAEMLDLAEAVYRAGRDEAAARSAKERGEKKLFGLMEEAKLEGFPVAIEGERPVIVDAVIEARESVTIDVAKLKKLVDLGTFLQIVTASQRSVTHQVGAVVAAKCLVPKVGERKLYVRARKD
jgi:hypothetical protein